MQQQIENARQDVDTNPTDAQKDAGNYKKGHIKLDGYDITIENPKGSTRSGKDASGKEWSVTMHNDYGYIRMTEGVDGDHIDVFLSDNPTEGNVYVIDQVKPDGTFDEHKVMYGFANEEEARQAYLSNYSEGWQGLGNITGVTKEEFKKWVESSHRKTKPFAEYKSVKPAVEEQAESTVDEEQETKPEGEAKPTADKKPTARSNRKIDDFGEKIGGARKDLVRDRIRTVRIMTPKDLKTLKKGADDILSVANILKLYKEGQMDEATARMFLAFNMAVKSAKGSLASGPIALRKYRDAAVAWEEGQPVTIEITDADIEEYKGDVGIPPSDERARESLEFTIMEPFNAYMQTYEAINYPAVERKLGQQVIKDYTKGRYAHTQSRPFWYMGSYHASRGYPFTNLKDAVAALEKNCPVVEKKEKGKKEKGEGEGHGLRIVQDGYRYYVKSRNIPGNIYLSKGFISKKEAEAYLNDNLDKLREKEQKMVDALLGSNIGMAEREGVDYRNGRDVTPDDFLNEFGFRGVEFGNWVPQAERQMYLNKTYDAIKDFCAIVGISPKAFSLGGRLGLAFGARGHSRAMAHYEPAKDVINLTRMSGVGSLAHEWFHALDNYLAKQKTGNVSDMASVTNDTARKVVGDVWNEMRTAMQRLDYHKRSSRAGEYWGRTEEEFARLFENYIYDRLAEKQAKSPVLVREDILLDNIGEDSVERNSWPYPSIAENRQMKPLFDKLFNTIQEKTDENGKMVLFHKVPNSVMEAEANARETELRDAVIDLMKQAGIEVSTDTEEGQRVLDADRESRAKTSRGKKRAPETVSVSQDEEHQQTVISSADGAKILNDLENYKSYLQNLPINPVKTFIGGLSKALRAKKHGSNSEYATFETKNGKIVTIRLADHNADISTFDNHKEDEGISIVITPKKSEGVKGNGKAHVVEFYYDAIKLRKADGKPLAEIVSSIQQALYSGEYKDTTGLAQREEVNADKVRFFRTQDGQAYGYTLNGKVYIDPRIATAETPIHEFAHLWAEALRKGNAKEWANVVSLMKGTPIWEEVKQNYPELTNDDDIAEEVLAHYSGRRGAERLRQAQAEAMEKAGSDVFAQAEAISAFDSVKRAIKRFWKAFADFLHIHYESAEEVADRVMADLLDGVNPNRELEKLQGDPHKAAQLDIVTGSNAMTDDYHVGIRSVDDIKTYQEAVGEGEGIDSYPDFTAEDAQRALDEGEVTVYSSKPIENGVFVSTSRMEAQDYAGDGKVYSKRVPLSDVAWIYANEGQYAKVDGSTQPMEAVSIDGDSRVRPQKVTDQKLIDRLESEPQETGYRNVVLNEDGTMGSPMASKLGNKGEKKATNPFNMNEWEQSEENPGIATEDGKVDLIKPNGKSIAKVDYNPYIHIRPTMVNKQFKEAWKRPELVYVQTAYPASELDGGYHAPKAKLSVGRHPWNGGELILSRYDKPLMVMPWEHVADDWEKEFVGKGVPFDIIPPKLLPILAGRGVEILPPHKGTGKDCQDAYEEWKKNNGNEEPLTRRDDEDLFDYAERVADDYARRRSKEPANAANGQEGGRRLDYDEAVEAAKVFEKRHKGAARTIVIDRRVDFRRQLEENGITGKRIDLYERWFEEGKTDAFYVIDKDCIVILKPGVAEKEFNLYLWHENFHKALREIYGTDADRKVKEVYDRLQSLEEYARELEQDVRDTYKGASEEEIREEVVTSFLEDLYNMRFEKDSPEEESDPVLVAKARKMSTDGSLNLLRETTNYIKYGRRFSDNPGTDSKSGEEQGQADGEEKKVEVRNPDGAGIRTAEGERRRVSPAAGGNTQSRTVGNRNNNQPEIERAAARQAYEKEVTSRAYEVRESLQDSMRGLHALYKAVLGDKFTHIEDVPDFMNAYTAENALSSSNQNQQVEYKVKYMIPLLDAVHKLTATDADGRELSEKEKEVQRENLTDYMMAKHGLERNRVLAARDAKRMSDDWLRDALTELNANLKRDIANLKGRLTRNEINQQQFDTKKAILEEKARRQKEAYEQEAERMRQAAEAENRQKDYAGLTALTGKKPNEVAEAEAKAKEMVDEYERDHDKADIDNLWDKTRKATRNTLEKTYKGGLQSKESYESTLDMFEYYIPLRGFDEKTSDEVYDYLMDDSGPLKGSVLKSAEGRRSKADDPIAWISHMADKAIMEANRNRMKHTFLNFVLNHPSDLVSVSDMWIGLDEATGNWKAMFPDIEPSDSPEVAQQKLDDFERRMKELHDQQPDKYKRVKDEPHIPYRVLNNNLREHQVIVKRNGVPTVLTINGNPRAAQAVNGMTNPDSNMSRFMQFVNTALGEILRFMSLAYTTAKLEFVEGNFLRDFVYTATVSFVKENANYAKNFEKNRIRFNPLMMHRLFRKFESGTLDDSNETERLFRQFMLNGGETGYTNVLDIMGHKKEIAKALKERDATAVSKVFSALGQQYDLLNRSVENVARFAAFVTSREMGRSMGRSIWDAKEISVNFNKKGSADKFFNKDKASLAGNIASGVTTLMRLTQVFFNAAVQALTNFGRVGKRNPKKASTLLTGLAMIGFLQPILAEMFSGGGDGDDDDYFNIPDYVRRSHIMVRIPGTDNWAMLPLTQEYRAIFGLGEMLASIMAGKETEDPAEAAWKVAEMMSQALPVDMFEGAGGLGKLVPSQAQPAYEVWVNKDWTGLPIYRQDVFPGDENKPEWTRVYKSADKTLVGLSKALSELTGGRGDYKRGAIEVNPAVVEHLMEGYFGGFWDTPMKLKKTFETLFGDRDFDPRNIFLLSRIMYRSDERTHDRRTQELFYRYKEEAEKTKSEVNGYTQELEKNGGVFDEAAMIDYLNYSDEYGRYQIYEKYRPDINAAKKAKKDAEKEGEEDEAEFYSKEEKRLMKDMVDEIQQFNRERK